MGFCLFVLSKRRSGQARSSIVSWANRSVGVPSCPAPPCPAAPLCAAPPRPAHGMSGFWTRRVIFRTFLGFARVLKCPKAAFSQANHGNTGAPKFFGDKPLTYSYHGIQLVPGHPWDKKGSQRPKKNVGLLMGIQELRALFVPVINQL